MCARRMKVPKLIVKDRQPVERETEKTKKSTPAVAQQCAACRFWTGEMNCRAFPNGIPRAILAGKHDHRKPYANDRGFRYSPFS